MATMSKTRNQEQSYVSIPQINNNNNSDDGQSQDEEFELQSLSSLDYENSTTDRVGQEDQNEAESQEGKSSMNMAFMNMANSILGAGIIGQPFALKNCGLIGGIIVLIFLSLLIDWTLRLMVMNAEISQTRSYQDTVNYCFGKYGKIVLLFTISSFAYGGCMAFCVIIGDTIPHVLKAFIPDSITASSSVIGWMFRRNTIIVIFTTCISYPLSLNRDISKLAKASGFALIGMLIIVLLTVVRGPFTDNELKAPLTKLEWTVNINIFQGISVISFALVCHHNTIFIYNSLRNATLARFAKLTHIACAVSMICCFVMGVNGFLNFGDNTKGNILNNFRSDDNWINLARFCFGLNMLTTFPLEIFVVRDVLKEVVFANHKTQGGSTSHLELSSRQHFIITSLLVFTSMAVSLFTCNLGIILELIGATSASLMAYIIPPLCHLKLSWNRTDYKNAGFADRREFIIWKLVPCIACTTFGFLVMFISSYMSIITNMKDADGGHCIGE